MVNRAPRANNDFRRVSENRDVVSGNVLLNDRDPDRDSLTVVAVAGDATRVGAALLGTYGTLVLNADGSYSYDLNNALASVQGLRSGQEAAETFTYAVADPSGATATATLTITIVGRNDAPLLTDDTVSAPVGGAPVTGALLANDSDADGDTLTVATVRSSGTTVAAGTALAGRYGTLTVQADGRYDYVVDETDAAVVRLGAGETLTETFRVSVTDGNGGTSTQRLVVTVVGRNDAPEASDDARSMSEDRTSVSGNVLTNDDDPDRDTLLVTAVTAQTRGAHGTLTLNADGSYRYDLDNASAAVEGLDDGEVLTDTFTYTVADPSGATDTATLTITIEGRNDRPVAAADSYTGFRNQSLTVAGPGVLANDIDPDGDPLTVASNTRAANGTVTVAADGSFTYTPNAGFVGTDSFTYRPFDGTTTGSSVRVSITVQASAPPVVGWAAPDIGGVAEGTPGGAPGGVLAFTLTRTGDLGAPTVVTFALATTGSGAAPGTPTASGGAVIAPVAGESGRFTLSFAAGQSSAVISVPALADAIDEPDDVVTLTLLSATGGTLPPTGQRTVTGRVLDDDLVADLRIGLERADGGGAVAAGGTASFRLTVTNDGPDAGDGTARFFLPSGATVQSVASEGGAPPPVVTVDRATATATWDFPALSSGSSASLLVTVALDAGLASGTRGFAAEIVTATLPDPDSTPGNSASNEDDYAVADVTVVAPPRADLSLSLLFDTPADSVAFGTDVDLLVRVTNSGPDAASGTVFLTAPTGVTFSPASGFDPATGLLTFGEIAPGDFIEIPINAVLASAGTLAITGEITSASLPDPDSTPGNGTLNGEDDQSTAAITVTAAPSLPTILFGAAVPLRALDPANLTVNTTTTDTQQTGAVAALAGGGHVITWESLGQDGSSWGIYAQRFDAMGAPDGTEFRVNSFTAGEQRHPAIAALRNGDFVITWSSVGQDGSGAGIYAQRYDAGGTPIGAEFVVNTTTAGPQVAPQIAALADGGFAITYEGRSSFSFSSGGTFLQRFDADGDRMGGETVPIPPRGYSVPSIPNAQLGHEFSSLAGLRDGGYVVVSNAFFFTASGPMNRFIVAQQFDAAGDPVGSPRTLASYYPTLEVEIVGVTALADGGYAVAYQVSRSQVEVQVFDADGNSAGPTIQVPNASNFATPALAATPTGGFVVSWLEFGPNGRDILARHYDSTGTPIGDAVQISADLPGEQLHRASAGGNPIAVAADGTLIATFFGQGEIVARRFETVVPIGGDEDTSIAMPIRVTPPPGGTLTEVVLTGLPVGSVLSAGVPSEGGTTWTFAGAPPANLTLTPPADFNGSFGLTVTATSVEGGTTVTGAASRIIVVNSVNDAPRDAQGNDAALGLTTAEDSPLTISIAALLADDTQPANENQTVTLNSVSNWGGGTVVDNGDGTLTFTPDADFNGTANFYYRAQDASGTVGDVVWVPVTVTPVADPPRFAITAQSATSVTEGTASGSGGAVTFTVTRVSGDLDAAEVTYRVGGGTSSPAGTADLANGIGTFPLQFAAGQMTATFTVAVQPDASDEPDETVRVDLASTSYGTVDPQAFQFTIVNDDGPPVFSLRPVTGAGAVYSEASSSPLDVVIERSGNISEAATVTYRIGPGSTGTPATSADLRDGLGTFTAQFGAGVASIVVPVHIANDTLVEADETLSISLIGTTVGTVNPAANEYVIESEDETTVYRLRANAVSLPEGNYQTVLIERSGNLDAAVVTLVVTPGLSGNPAESEDFLDRSLYSQVPTESFAEGASLGFFVLRYDTDVLAEGAETVRVTLLSATDTGQGAVIAPDAQFLEFTILDGPPLASQNGDLWFGTPGPDAFNGRGGNDEIYGLGGNDTLMGSLDNDLIFGGDGNDDLEGGPGDDALYGELGNDSISGGVGNDLLDGGSGNDFLDAGLGDDRLEGGAGDDLLLGGSGADHYVGGADGGTWQIVSANGRQTIDVTGGDQINLSLPNSFSGTFGGNWFDGYADIVTYSVVAGDGVDRITHFEPGVDQIRIDLGDDTAEIREVDGRTLITFGSYGAGALIISSTSATPLVVGRDIIFLNELPVANPDAITIPENLGWSNLHFVNVLANDTDADNDPLELLSVAPVGGAPLVADIANNQIRFYVDDPSGDVNGVFQLAYAVSDGKATSNGLVTVTVTPQNDAPRDPEGNDAALRLSIAEDMSLAFSTEFLLEDDVQPADETGPITLFDISGVVGGTVADNGEGTLIFTTNLNFNGAAGFNYRAQDAQGAVGDFVWVPINVTPVADRLIVVDDFIPLQFPGGGTQRITGAQMVGNDTDVDGNAVIVGVTAVSGILDIRFYGDQSVQIDYAAGARPVFTYRLGNAAGLVEGTVTIGVPNAAPRDPEGNDAALGLTTAEDTPLTISIAALLADDTQPADENQDTVLSGVSGAVGGTVSVNSGAGQILFTPNADFNGAGGFFYRAADTLGAVGEEVWVPVTVTPVASPARIQFGNQLTPLGVGDSRANTTTVDVQRNSGLAPLTDGGFVVTWSSLNQDGSGFGVYAQRYDANGGPVGAEVLVNTTTDSSQTEASATGLSGGGYVIAWTGFGQLGSSDIFAQRYDAAGQRVGGEVQVNTTTAGEQRNPDVTRLGDGGYLITWSSYSVNVTSIDVYGQRYSATGVAIGGEFRVDPGVANSRYPSATPLVDGSFVVAFSEDPTGIYVQRYSAAGVNSGGAVRIDSGFISSIAGLADGGFVVTWDAMVGGSYEVFAQRFDAAGVAVGGSIRVNTTTMSFQGDPNVSALPDGGYVVSWTGRDQGLSSGIFAQRFSATGVPIGGEIRLNDTTVGEQVHSVFEAGAGLATLIDGTVVATWYGERDVFVRRFSTDIPTTTSGAEDSAIPLNVFVAPTDANETVTTVVLTGLPPGSVLSAGTPSNFGQTWTFSGPPPADLTFTPPENYNGSFTLTVTATTAEGGTTATGTASRTVVVNSVNDAPFVDVSIPDAAATVGTAFSFEIPEDAFADPDGDGLLRSATLDNGDPLPSWLTYDGIITFSGTPPAGSAGTLRITVSAADDQFTASDTFDLVIAPGPAEIAFAQADVGSLAEGNGPGFSSSLEFVISRTGDLSRESTVTFTLDAPLGSSLTADDIGLVAAGGNGLGSGFGPFTATFAAGEASKTIFVFPTGDTLPEAEEAVRLTLAGPTGATLSTTGPLTATGTIQNDDLPPPVVALDADTFGSVLEGNGGRDADLNPLPPNTLSFGIVRTGDVSAASTVTFTLSDGGSGGLTADDIIGVSLAGGSSSSLAGSGLGPYTATFAPGEQNLSVTVSIQGDRAVEGNETLRVTLTGAGDATLSTTGPLTATGTIQNDDMPPPPPPVVALDADTFGSVLEGNGGRDADLNPLPPNTLSFGIVRTGDVSAASTVTFTLSDGGSGGLTADDIIGVSLAGGSSSSLAGSGLGPYTATFAPGEQNLSVTVSIQGDRAVEGNETLRVTLTGAGDATLSTTGPLTATGTIQNDDMPPPPPPVVALDADTFGSVLEGNGGRDADLNPLPPNTLSFGIVRTGDVSAASTVTFTLSDGGSGGLTADDIIGVSLAGGSSSSLAGSGLGPYTATFAPGEQNLSVTVSIQGDRAVEGNETLRVTLTGAGDATLSTTGPLTATGTIQNDDMPPPPPPVVALDADTFGSVLEGNGGRDADLNPLPPNTLSFGIVRTGDVSAASTVTFTLSDGGSGGLTADDIIDVSLAGRSLSSLTGSVLGPYTATFAPGEQDLTVTVSIQGDRVVEGNETLLVTLTGAGDATLSTTGPLVATGTITDDDTVQPPVFTLTSFTGTNALVREDFSATSPVGVTVNRTGDLSQAATVTYRVEGGLTGISASAADLQAGFGDFTLSFAAGQTQAVGLVFLTDDLLREPDETFRVSLVSSSVGTVSTNVNEFTIQDDDSVGPPPPGPGSLFFSGVSPGSGRELWAFDPAQGTPPTGTPIARPVDFAETLSGPGGSNPLEITQIDETVFWRAENEVGFNWYALAPTSGFGRQQLAVLGADAFDTALAVEDRTLSAVTDGNIFLSSGSGSDVLMVYDHNGTNYGQVGLQGQDRSLLTAMGDGVAYTAYVDSELQDGSFALVEQLFVVLPDATAADGWVSIAPTSFIPAFGEPDVVQALDIREIAGFETTQRNFGGVTLTEKTLFFSGDYLDSSGFRLDNSLFSVTASNNGFLWSFSYGEFVPGGTGTAAPLAPRELTVAETGRGDTLFFFGTADASGGGSEGRIFAVTTRADGALETASSLAASGSGISQGIDIVAYSGGVAFSAITANGRAIINTTTDADGDGVFSTAGIFDGLGGTIEDLVTDAAGNIAFTWDQGFNETLYLWRPDAGFGTPELRNLVTRGGTVKEIDELRLEGGRLTYRMDSSAGDFPTLYVHDIAAGAGNEIGTDAFTGGTAFGAVGGASLVATDFGVAFQADISPVVGTRLVTAQGGSIPDQSFNLTVNLTAELFLGSGIAFDDAWIGTGFDNATAVNGLLRADAAGTQTLYQTSPNLSATVAGLGREVLFGETTDATNDILIHNLETRTTSTLLADHLIGSATTIGSQIIFSARDASRPENGFSLPEDDVWSLYRYQGGVVTFLADLPNGYSGQLQDDPIVPFSTTGESFFGQGDRIFWKQLNDAAGAGVEVHSINLAAADIPGSLTLYDTAPGATSGGDFNSAVFLGGRFYFAASTDGSFAQARLYATDGTSPPVAVTGPDLPASFAFPFELTAVGDEFFFTARDATDGRQRVFQLDDSGVTATKLELPGVGDDPLDGVVIELADLGDRVGVIAFENGIDQVFVFTPGAQPGGQTGVTQLTSFTDSASISSLTRGGDDEFYFTRTTQAEGRELWVIDSTVPEGARLLKDLNLTPVPVGYRPEQVADFLV